MREAVRADPASCLADATCVDNPAPHQTRTNITPALVTFLDGGLSLDTFRWIRERITFLSYAHKNKCLYISCDLKNYSYDYL